MSHKNSDRLKKIIAGIQKAADAAGVHPSEVNKSLFFTHVEDVTPWDLREVGGLAMVRNSHYPIVSKDLLTIREQKETGKYIKELENKLADKQSFEMALERGINKIVVPKSVQPYKPVTKKRNKLKRSVVVMLNDTHYGLLVNGAEVGGVNAFSWIEACRRSALLLKNVIDYKIDKRDDVDAVHLILNGDMIAGVIHDLTARTHELLIHQVNGAVHILTHFIEGLAANYPSVVVHGVSGNHDDAIHRREGGRVLSHKYDSYTNMIYYTLSAVFRQAENIKFNFPQTLYGAISFPAGRLIYSHGDTMFSSVLGNPGNTLNTRRLSDAINRFNQGEIELKRAKGSIFMFGHVHTHTMFTTFDGVKVLIAPSLSGVDAYAASLSINHNQIGQLMFESTSEHLLGDSRLVELQDADSNASLDKIIPIFDNGLSFKK